MHMECFFSGGNFVEAEKHFRVAIKRLTWRSPNPYNSEPYANLGRVYFRINQTRHMLHFIAAWSNERQRCHTVCLLTEEDRTTNLHWKLVERKPMKNINNRRNKGGV